MGSGRVEDRQGIVLIVVLGVLVLMALLATSFATLQSVERRVTHNYTDLVRAKLAAQSGVEMAVDRLKHTISDGWFRNPDKSWHYFGSESDRAREWELQTTDYVKLQTPLELAAAPSYSAGKIKVEGTEIGYSGTVGGTYRSGGDLYQLKVLDCQGQINVNDGVRWGNRHSVSQNLRRLLNTLGAQPEVSVPKLGDRVIDRRPPGGFATKLELARILTAAEMRRVGDLLTANSWSNPNVVSPVPLSVEEYRADVYPVVPNAQGDGYARPVDAAGRKLFRYGHGKNILGEPIDRPSRPWPLRFWDPARDPDDASLTWSQPASCYHSVWTRDALNPQWIETVERSPVNVNTASRPTLMALVSGLEGFFEISRRRPVPFEMYYKWLFHAYNYGPDYGNVAGADGLGSETGFLYRTIPFQGPGTTGAAGIAASKIVDEMLACRYRRPSPNIPGCSYAVEPFGGPFRTWQQFHRFADFLVERGVILDSRPIFFDYKPDYYVTPILAFGIVPLNPWTVSNLKRVDSPAQRRFASQAAADVLKANFNPNAHLNELNFDRNLHAQVDKTDLIVHSTEFCFTPMGRFEIESLGRVVRAKGTGTALAADLDHEVVAQSRVYSVAEFYRPHHETTQKQFMAGTFGPREAVTATNNNCSTESGPEPDNGVAPLECEYDGYVALPTLGGIHNQPGGLAKAKGALAATPAGSGGDGFQSTIHSHFQLDHAAHHHAGGAANCRPIGRYANAGERASTNVPDKTETIPGPYGPIEGSRYRLCRSFPAGSTLAAAPFAPSDLRLDGAYTELNSAVGYDLSTVPASTQLTLSYWIKPNWYPELGGKVRTFFSVNNWELYFTRPTVSVSIFPNLVWMSRPQPFGLYYMSSYGGEDPWRTYYQQPPRKNSLVWAIGADACDTRYPGGAGMISPTLNHEFEPWFDPAATEDFDRFTSARHAGKFNELRGHEWVHVTATVSAGSNNARYAGGAEDPTRYDRMVRRLSLMINGRELPGTDQMAVHLTYDLWPTLNFAIQGKSIRLGGEYGEMGRQSVSVSSTTWKAFTLNSNETRVMGTIAGKYQTYRQYFADSTIDEFYYWRDNPNSIFQAQAIFARGRYYRPWDSTPNTPAGDALYTSRDFSVDRGRPLAPGNSMVPSSEGVQVAAPLSAADERGEVVAVQWTSMAEDVGRAQDSDGTWRLKPVMFDYRTLPSGGRPAAMSPGAGPDANGFSYETLAQMFVVVEDAAGAVRNFGPFHDEGWSRVAAGLRRGDRIKYVVKLRPTPNGAALNTLLATPVLDDATLFVSEGSARYVAYVEVRQ
jgi:hypothetical protein